MFREQLITEGAVGTPMGMNHFGFKRLFDELYPELVGYAYGYLFVSESSEDMVQEVFVDLWENQGKLDSVINLRAYLYAMVRNRCLDSLKAVKITDNSRILETHAVFDVEYHPDSFPEDEQKLLYDQVLMVLEGLPKKMRHIVRLRFFENYRYNEIADELGISVNTVKTQLKRAKVKFGELIISMIIGFFLF